MSRNLTQRPRKCRDCGASSEDKSFRKGKNWCKECASAYDRSWKEKNADHLKEYRSRPEFKKNRQKAVRKAQQRSPESFLLHLMHHITKYSNHKKKNQKKLNPAALDVQIDYEYLLELYRKQDGKCAILGIPLKYEFNNLQTMSIDRIDSSKGYIPGNIQIVCQFINTAKRHYSNDDVNQILNSYFQHRTLLAHQI